jgi:hypothetical protein
MLSTPWAALYGLSLACLVLPSQPSASGPESVTLQGTVEKLTDLLPPLGLAVDADPIASQVAVKGDDGTITPLFSDDASRALFKDDRLRHRRAVVQGRKYPGLPYLQVVSFKIEDQGKLKTPEYYCEICTISVRYPQICPCCQGPMVLRMLPDAP